MLLKTVLFLTLLTFFFYSHTWQYFLSVLLFFIIFILEGNSLFLFGYVSNAENFTRYVSVT